MLRDPFWTLEAATGHILWPFWPNGQWPYLAICIPSNPNWVKHWLNMVEHCISLLSDPGIPGVRSMGPSVSNRPFWNFIQVINSIQVILSHLTDVTLSNPAILTDSANRAIQGNVAMQVTQFNLVGKFVTNACGAIWWPNLQLMQMAPSGGQIWN